MISSISLFCIYKNLCNQWIVLDSGERREGYIYGIYDNVIDACKCLIDVVCRNKAQKKQSKIEF